MTIKPGIHVSLTMACCAAVKSKCSLSLWQKKLQQLLPAYHTTTANGTATEVSWKVGNLCSRRFWVSYHKQASLSGSFYVKASTGHLKARPYRPYLFIWWKLQVGLPTYAYGWEVISSTTPPPLTEWECKISCIFKGRICAQIFLKLLCHQAPKSKCIYAHKMMQLRMS